MKSPIVSMICFAGYVRQTYNIILCHTTWGMGDSNIKMPGCVVCLVSENIPITNGTLSCKTYPY